MARILVIEDNAENLELMVYLLDASGHQTITARDGHSGVTIAASENPDLIICDIQLPGLDGYEIARAMAARPFRPPLIAVTAFAMVGDREKLLSSGFDGYLPKPITPETFVQQIEAFLCSGDRGEALGIARAEPWPMF